jgi:hypothetical protein
VQELGAVVEIKTVLGAALEAQKASSRPRTRPGAAPRTRRGTGPGPFGGSTGSTSDLLPSGCGLSASGG